MHRLITHLHVPVAIGIVFGFFALGCSDPQQEVATSSPRSGEVLTIDAVPVLELGVDATKDGQNFGAVTGVLLRSDGSVLVADAGGPEIKQFDAAGALVFRFGQAGDGPNDFRFLRSVAECGGDSIAVLHGRRVTILTPTGEFFSVIDSDASEGAVESEGVGASCALVVWQARSSVPYDTSGVVELFTTLYATEGESRSEILRFVAAKRFRTSVNGMPAMAATPWSPEPSWATSHGVVFWASAANDTVRAWNRDRGWIDVSFEHRKVAVTVADRAKYAAYRDKVVAVEPQMARSLLPLEQLPSVPEYQPTLAGLIAESDSVVWIRSYPGPSVGILGAISIPDNRGERWTVLNVHSGVQSAIQSPPGVKLLSVRNGRVAGVRLGPDDEEYVVVHTLRRSAAARP